MGGWKGVRVRRELSWGSKAVRSRARSRWRWKVEYQVVLTLVQKYVRVTDARNVGREGKVVEEVGTWWVDDVLRAVGSLPRSSLALQHHQRLQRSPPTQVASARRKVQCLDWSCRRLHDWLRLTDSGPWLIRLIPSGKASATTATVAITVSQCGASTLRRGYAFAPIPAAEQVSWSLVRKFCCSQNLRIRIPPR